MSSMASIDELRGDESFDVFEDGIETILNAVEDPELVEERLQQGEYDAALEHVEMEKEDVELKLEIVGALAKEIAKENPELLDEIATELGEDKVEV